MEVPSAAKEEQAMYRTLILLAAVVIAVAATAPAAHAGFAFTHGFAWVNDHDGDGIPNGQDEDWIRPMDGSGYKFRHGQAGLTGARRGPAASGGAFQYHHQNRFKSGPGSQSGTCPLKVRLRLRDGSCI
jgi:hypothetical protein